MKTAWKVVARYQDRLFSMMRVMPEDNFRVEYIPNQWATDSTATPKTTLCLYLAEHAN